MTNRKYSVFLIIVIILFTAFAAGCKKSSKSDENPVSPTLPGGTTNQLAGTWKMTKVTITNPDNSIQVLTPTQAGFNITWVFKTDNTYTFTIVQQGGNSEKKGTYTYTNNTIVIKDENNNVVDYQLKLSNGVLTMPVTLEQDGVQFGAVIEFSK